MATATDLQRLIVSMEARSAKFERDLNKASLAASRSANQIEGRFRRMNTNLTSGFSAFGRAFTKAFALAGISVGVAQIPRIIGDIVAEASGLAKTADRIGVTTGQLQELQHAARLADVEISSFNKAMEFFGKTIGEALQGNGELLRVLQANGVALRDANGNVRTQSDLLNIYADLVKNAASEQERLRLAQIAFGRSGLETVTMLQNGAAGLRENAEEARRLGLVIEDDLLRKAEELNDDWTRFTQSMSTRFKEFVLAVSSGVHLTITDLDRLRNALQFPADKDRAAGAFVGGLLGSGLPPIPGAAAPEAPGRPTVLPTQLDDAATRSAQMRADAIAKVIERLTFEQEQLGRTNREQAIYNELSKAGVDINSEAGQQIASLAGALFDQEEALKSAKDAADEFNKAMESIGNDAFDAFESIITGAKSAKDAILDLIAQLILAQARASFLSAFGAGTSGGPLSSIFGALFGGSRAVGGSISPGKIYKVHKDELIATRVPGTVIPASQAKAGAGGGRVDVTIGVDRTGNIVPLIRSVSGEVSVRTTQAALTASERQRSRDQLRAG